MQLVQHACQRQQQNMRVASINTDKDQTPDRVKLRMLWDEEYARNPTIPSSHRSEPAHALVELGKHFDIQGLTALDLGCGNGRNALFLADMGIKVTALDFSGVALQMLEKSIAERKCSAAIEIVNHDLYDGLPFGDASFDLVLDSYCLCHFVDREQNAHAMSECQRVLRPGGRLIKIHLDSKDAYYLERVHEKTEFGHVSRDPVNGLQKIHCDVESYAHFFASALNLETSLNIDFIDSVRGKDYERSIFVSVMKKP